MTMEIMVNGSYPKSKKAIKEAVKAGRFSDILLVGTSWFGNEPTDTLDKVPGGLYTYVLDPATRRSFGNVRVSVDASGKRTYKFDN